MNDMIDMTTANLAVDNLGEMWEDFAARLTPDAAILFKDAYNLIYLSFPDSYMDITITNILIDEGLETGDTIQHIRKFFIETIVDCLQIMGIIIDMDYVGPDQLPDLVHTLDTIYLMDQMDDLLGMIAVLEDDLIDSKDRFIEVIRRVDPSWDIENFCYMIKEVSPNVAKGLMIGLRAIPDDDTTYMDPSLKKRILDNKDFLANTFGKAHLVNGGGTALALEGLMGMFINELSVLLVSNEELYYTNVLSLMLISSLTDGEIVSQFNALIESQASTLEQVYKFQSILKRVNLNE